MHRKFRNALAFLVSLPSGLFVACTLDNAHAQHLAHSSHNATKGADDCIVTREQLDEFHKRGYIGIPLQDEHARQLNDLDFWNATAVSEGPLQT